ncbi:MAG TPA: alpha/beta hydrolase [Bradyrhizobium sp.]|jgi:pimeloyl-ACP methyl ester carboxylesterase|nr:alpha/beta hydrolase [Bradyrhizobium sp.]
MQRFIPLLIACLIMFAGAAQAEPPRLAQQQWLTLPPTPHLPDNAIKSGYAPVNGVKIWYSVFGRGKPVILLHGGLANSNYWGRLVPALSSRYQVIVMDSRGHGRSTRSSEPIGYDLMASDVLAVMDSLKIENAALVGWSDGAIIGLDIAINHPARLTRLFAFAANSDPDGVADIANSPVFNKYLERAKAEYQKLSPTPKEYDSFLAQITKMWETQPHFTADDLHRITTPTWIVDADHDEAIKRSNTLFMADQIPNSGLLIEPRVSHFAFLQDAEQFNDDVLHFLEQE